MRTNRGGPVKSWMIVGLFFLLPFNVNAESVLQAKGNQFLMEAGSFRAGETLTIFGPDGKPKGTARVRTPGKSKSLADVTAGTVAQGDTVSLQTGATAPAKSGGSRASANKKKFVMGVGLSMGLMNTFKGSGTYTLSGVTTPLTTDGKSATGFGIMAEAQYWFTDMMGAIGGFEYEFEHKIDGGLSTTANNTTTTAPIDDKIQFMYLVGNFALRFGNLYFPMGINYPILKYTTTNTPQVAAQLGYQLGAGYTFLDRFSVEFIYRITNFQLRIDRSIPDSFIFTSASNTGMLLQGKFYF